MTFSSPQRENGRVLVEFREGGSGNNKVIRTGVPVVSVLHSGPVILLSALKLGSLSLP